MFVYCTYGLCDCACVCAHMHVNHILCLTAVSYTDSSPGVEGLTVRQQQDGIHTCTVCIIHLETIEYVTEFKTYRSHTNHTLSHPRTKASACNGHKPSFRTKFSGEMHTGNFNTTTKMVIYTLHLSSFIKASLTGELIVPYSWLASTV